MFNHLKKESSKFVFRIPIIIFSIILIPIVVFCLFYYTAQQMFSGNINVSSKIVYNTACDSLSKTKDGATIVNNLICMDIIVFLFNRGYYIFYT
ncbi:hypothetical protein DKP74_06165 [Fructilactobacillus sanfranciscensis]|nr:hypothetical protein DKP74_06165 [Fructilactobacillus sanfranciscensis]TNK97087.1 hypothetical protein DKP75_05640 [Fructilactobacillus sanfranciscensis]